MMSAMPAHAQFNVGAGTTDTSGKNIAGAAGTVAAGGTLTTGGVAGSEGVVTITVGAGTSSITNAGTISQTGTGRTIDVNTGTPVLTITNQAGGLITAAGAEAIRLNRAPGRYIIDNQGTISQTGPAVNGSRAIKADSNFTSLGNQIINGSTSNSNAVISATGNDALRLGSNFTLTNYGRIFSTGSVNTSCPSYMQTPVNLCVNDFSASDGVAIENGRSNVVIINHGSITGPRHGVDGGDPVATAASAGLLGIDRLVITSEGPTGVTLNSVTNGVTTTGVTIANPIVINHAGASIVGKNGSGVGLDGHGVVFNKGLISGNYAGAGNIYDHEGLGVTTSNGDGDGVDIDGIAYIENSGRIEGTGAGGKDSGGSLNGADGIAAGGGTIVNLAGGVIFGQSKGILIDDGAAGTAIPAQRGTATATGGAARIFNDGTITGERGAAIGLVGNFDDRLMNSATGVITGGAGSMQVDVEGSTTAAAAVQMGAGNDTLTNYGRIEGRNGLAIDMGAGNDLAQLFAGGSTGVIVGRVNGGDGIDTLETGGVQRFAQGNVLGFERFVVRDGSTTFNYALGNVQSVQVDAGAVLQINGGFGTSGNLDVNGTLKASADPALRTVQVGGNYAQGAAGVLEMKLGAANASDKLAVAGTAALAAGATVRPVPMGYVADGSRYTLVSAAGGLNSAAALPTTSDSALVRYTLAAQGNDLVLSAQRTATLANVAPAGLGGLGGALDALGTSGNARIAALLGRIDGLASREAASNAIRQLAPETNGAAMQATQLASSAMFTALNTRMDTARSGGNTAGVPVASGMSGGDAMGRRAWAQGLGAWGEQKQRAGANGYDLDAYGFAAGIETDRSAHEVMGLSIGLNHANADGRGTGNGNDVQVKGTNLAGYFSSNTTGMTLDVSAMLGHNRYDSARRVSIGGVTENLAGDYKGWQVGAQVEAGFPFAVGADTSERWLVGARASHLSTDGYDERGGSAALRVGSNDSTSLQSVLGVELTRAASPQSSLQLRARWLHEFADAQDINASFVAGGPSFTSSGVKPNRDALQLGIGWRHVPSKGVSLTLGYDAEFRKQYLAHQLSARAVWSF